MNGAADDAARTDAVFMRRALQLARRGAGQVAPNPLVGAVVVRDGAVVGEGWHAHYGGAHAEVVALHAAGDAAAGSTVYVTLEPCNHTGKTPPCTHALIDARVARVAFASADPNPIAAGGADVLRAHGIAVTAGVLRARADEVNAPFLFSARGADRPFVTLKLALSIDGAIVDASRAHAWLTGSLARRAVHRLRAASDAVAVGIGTALVDDPALTVRAGAAPRVPPRRVVFDRTGRLPLASTLVRTAGEVPVTLVAAPAALGSPAAQDGASARLAALAAAGVTVHRATTLGDGLRGLHESGVRHLFVEGGAGLASALLQAGLVDRLITFQAPVVLGAGALPAFDALTAPPGGLRMRVVRRRRLGDDLMTVYAPAVHAPAVHAPAG